MEKLTTFDAADFLKDEEDMQLYLQACAEEGNSDLMVAALGDVARARNMAVLAREAGLSRKGLYKALSGQGNPSFATVTKVAKAVGFQVQIVLAQTKVEIPVGKPLQKMVSRASESARSMASGQYAPAAKAAKRAPAKNLPATAAAAATKKPTRPTKKQPAKKTG